MIAITYSTLNHWKLFWLLEIAAKTVFRYNDKYFTLPFNDILTIAQWMEDNYVTCN